MRVIGIVGFQGSGKTYLGVEIAKELTSRGYKVSAVKHTRGVLDFPKKDTTQYKKYCEQVIAVSRTETVKFFKNGQNLEAIVQLLKSDFVIIEGFKENKTFPRIICLRESREEYSDDLQIATIIKDKLTQKKIKELCNLIEKKAFKLPGLNCRKCGFSSCYGLAKEIVKGKKTVEDCQSMKEEISVLINGQRIFLNPFVGKIFKGTIQCFLNNLRGFKSGEVEIKIK